MSEYERILEQLGDFGPYQVRVFILVSMFETPLAWAMLLPIFSGAVPSWECLDHVNGSETSGNASDWSASAGNVTNSTTAASSSCPCANMTFGGEFTSVASEWSLLCDRDYIPDLITTLQMVGVFGGVFVTGQLADTFGRRKVLFIEYAVLLVVLFASAFSNSWQLYAALRCLIGALVGGTLVVNFVLPLEFVTPAWRTFCGAIGFWAVGLMTLALWAFLVRDWRHLTMATAITGIPILLSWWFVPESPRWLLSRGRTKEAEEILTKVADFNKKPRPDFSLLDTFVKKEQQRVSSQKNFSYHHLFSSWPIARGTLVLMYGWFVSSAVYYGLNFNAKNLSGNRYLNAFLSGLVEIPALIFVVYVNNRLGRRWTTSVLMLIAGVFCFSILFVDLAGKLKTLSGLTLGLSLVGKAGIAGGWAALQVFSAETFPTVVRNLGISSCSMAARIGGIAAPQFVYLGKDHQPLPFTIFGILALLCGLLVLLVPETVGLPLPDQIQRVPEPQIPNGAHPPSQELAESERPGPSSPQSQLEEEKAEAQMSLL